MQKWEYKVIEVSTNENVLNALGAEGWELVAVAEDYQRLYFKRPIS
jgi:hypothetical protein